jgi:hypothetical protein
MHRQQAWEERSGDPRLPRWMRVTALAYAKHRGNGHAYLREPTTRDLPVAVVCQGAPSDMDGSGAIAGWVEVKLYRREAERELDASKLDLAA